MSKQLDRIQWTAILFCVALLIGCQKKPDTRNSKADPVRTNEGLPTDQSPNIILIYTDDIDCESVFANWPEQPADNIRFPNLKRLAEQGTTFTNFHVTTPVCGPSRASLFSGQYAHRHGIKVNTPNVPSANGFPGGYGLYNKEQELGLWMKQAGYQTAFVGKYMHDGFVPDGSKSEGWGDLLPNGWDHFECSLGGKYVGFNHVNNRTKTTKRISEYRTDFESRLVVDLIENQLGPKNRDNGTGDDTRNGFFLCWTPFASHLTKEFSDMTAERHTGMFQDVSLTGIDQANDYLTFDHRPEEMTKIPKYEKTVLDGWAGTYHHRLRSIQALDEGIGKMMAALEKTNQLDNTIIIFTSDHGASQGQHGHFGKRFPYDRITKVPFIAKGPGIPGNQQCDQLLANIDIAPTLIDIASGKQPDSCDGLSFAELLTNPGQTTGRDAIIIENWDRIWCNTVFIASAYCSLRTHHHIYTEWASGSFEYFDMASDPNQKNNLYAELDEQKRKELKQTLAELRGRHNQSPSFGNEFKFPIAHDERRVFSANFRPADFSGFAEDDNGIEKVELEFYCDKIQSWWDGKGWSEQKTLVPANLGMPKGHVSRWSYTLDTAAFTFADDSPMNRRDTVINALVTDVDGNQTRWEKAFEFKMRINDPETWIDPPAPWSDRQQPFRISGRAADNRKVSRVEALTLDLDRNLFWNSEQRKWVKERVRFEVPLKPLQTEEPGDWVTWDYEFDGPQKGKLFFCFRAYDAEGKFDASLPFHIEDPVDE